MKRAALIALLILPRMSQGLIVLDSRTSMDNDFNTSAPPSNSPSYGAPWSNVAQQQRLVSDSPIIDSSAVYLGNGYVLTANHTYGPNFVILDGASYSVDTSFPAIGLAPFDLRLYKILNPPPLALVPLPDSWEDDLGVACTMIGWGTGKGSVVSNLGWTWGDDTTKNKRWGTNTTASTTALMANIPNYPYSYNAIYTTFEAITRPSTATGQTEATATMGDSGGGIFQQFSGTWKLAGIMTLVSYDGYSYYNQNPPHASFAVRMKDVASKFRYRQWKASKGIALEASATEDSDSDGLGLLEEYAFGSDPASASPGVAPKASVEGTDVALTYQLERTRTDLIVTVEESPDLVTWSPASVSATTTVSDNGTIRTYKAKVPFDGAQKKFLRLSVSALTN